MMKNECNNCLLKLKFINPRLIPGVRIGPLRHQLVSVVCCGDGIRRPSHIHVSYSCGPAFAHHMAGLTTICGTCIYPVNMNMYIFLNILHIANTGASVVSLSQSKLVLVLAEKNTTDFPSGV